MRIRALLVIALAALLAPAAAHAAGPAAVRLLACDPQARFADFSGDMRAIPGTERMQMRFSVRLREPGRRRWERVRAPGLDTWVTSAPGRARYVFDKHVAGLAPGAYRMVVRFRWRDADGAIVRTLTRRSRPCRVPDPRADLTPVAVDAAPGATAGTRRYVVTVENRGRADAGAFDVSLRVGDTILPDRRAGPLAAGESAQVAFDGPACASGDLLIVGVDAGGSVDEAREADDVATFACPVA